MQVKGKESLLSDQSDTSRECFFMLKANSYSKEFHFHLVRTVAANIYLEKSLGFVLSYRCIIDCLGSNFRFCR